MIQLIYNGIHPFIFQYQLRDTAAAALHYFIAGRPQIRIQCTVDSLRHTIVIVAILLTVIVKVAVHVFNRFLNIVERPLAVIYYLVQVTYLIVLGIYFVKEVAVVSEKSPTASSAVLL